MLFKQKNKMKITVLDVEKTSEAMEKVVSGELSEKEAKRILDSIPIYTVFTDNWSIVREDEDGVVLAGYDFKSEDGYSIRGAFAYNKLALPTLHQAMLGVEAMKLQSFEKYQLANIIDKLGKYNGIYEDGVDLSLTSDIYRLLEPNPDNEEETVETAFAKLVKQYAIPALMSKDYISEKDVNKFKFIPTAVYQDDNIYGFAKLSNILAINPYTENMYNIMLSVNDEGDVIYDIEDLSGMHSLYITQFLNLQFLKSLAVAQGIWEDLTPEMKRDIEPIELLMPAPEALRKAYAEMVAKNVDAMEDALDENE